MRLFVAVDLSDEVREKLSPLLAELSKMSGLKTVEKENLHATLLFLGEVPEMKVPQIREELSKIKFESFKIELSEVGAFPSVSNPRVVWIGAKDDGKLKMLADEVYERLKKLGFKRDKDFVAHITIARVKRRCENLKNFVSIHAKDKFGEMIVDNFKLKQSILRPQGPIYKDVEVFKALK